LNRRLACVGERITAMYDAIEKLCGTLKELGALISEFAKLATPSGMAREWKKTRKTIAEIADVEKGRRGQSSAEKLAVGLRGLKFESTGIRGTMRALLLHPTKDWVSRLNVQVTPNLILLERLWGGALKDEAFVARNSKLISKVQKIKETKKTFYFVFGLDTGEFSRSIAGYLSAPDSVPLKTRQQFMADLDNMFDQVDEDIEEAVAMIEEYVREKS
jgi:hypothetical protein